MKYPGTALTAMSESERQKRVDAGNSPFTSLFRASGDRDVFNTASQASVKVLLEILRKEANGSSPA